MTVNFGEQDLSFTMRLARSQARQFEVYINIDTDFYTRAQAPDGEFALDTHRGDKPILSRVPPPGSSSGSTVIDCPGARAVTSRDRRTIRVVVPSRCLVNYFGEVDRRLRAQVEVVGFRGDRFVANGAAPSYAYDGVEFLGWVARG